MARDARQVELVLEHDDFAERLEREFAIILLPVVDRAMPQDRCREVAGRLALHASRRARDAGRLAALPKPSPCAGCDAPVEQGEGVVLCARCAGDIKSPGSEG